MVGARSIVFPNRGTSRSQGLCGADTRRYYTAGDIRGTDLKDTPANGTRR